MVIHKTALYLFFLEELLLFLNLIHTQYTYFLLYLPCCNKQIVTKGDTDAKKHIPNH